MNRQDAINYLAKKSLEGFFHDMTHVIMESENIEMTGDSYIHAGHRYTNIKITIMSKLTLVEKYNDERLGHTE